LFFFIYQGKEKIRKFVEMEDFMLMKRSIVFFMAAVLLTAGLFAGGGGQQSSSSASSAGGGNITPGVVTYPVPGNPKITVARTVDNNLVTGGYTSYNDAPGVKEFTRQNGITAEFIELVDGTAFLVYLAGRNLPDAIHDTKTFYPGGPGKMHMDGLAQDLTDLLPQYAPDYWKFIHTEDVYYKDIREADGRHLYFSGYFRIPTSLNALDRPCSQTGIS